MKILLITGENDYAALDFEETYRNQHVDKIMKSLSKGEKLEGEGGEIDYRIVDVPDIVISKEFRDFIKRDVMNYDGSKHCNFYLETDIVK